MKIALIVLACIVGLFTMEFIFTGGDLAMYRFWAPKQENAKRVVFENTQSYIQGKQEYISRLRYQFLMADGAQKEALRMLILSEAATVDTTKLSPDVQGFLRVIGGAQ